MFNEVIKHFSRSGHVHYNAIANELAGKFMLKFDDKEWAQQYFERACFLYDDWGAQVKVEKMTKKYSTLIRPLEDRPTDRFSMTASIQGVSRYDLKKDSFMRSWASPSSAEFSSQFNTSSADMHLQSQRQLSSSDFVATRRYK